MKKHLIPAALAMIAAFPAHAQSVNETHVKRTVTAVEKAAIEQGFISRGEGAELLGLGETQPPQDDVTGNHSVMMMAPQAPEAVESAAPAAPAASGNRPSLIRQTLPAGLVMDGPGTEAWKKRKKKRAAAAAAKKQEVAPAAKAIAAPVRMEPEALPDQNALPPSSSMPATPVEEPAPAFDPAPALEPAMEEAPETELAPPDNPFAP